MTDFDYMNAYGQPDYTLGSRGLTDQFNRGQHTDTLTGGIGPMSARTARLAGGGVPDALQASPLVPVPSNGVGTPQSATIPPQRPNHGQTLTPGMLQALHQAQHPGGSVTAPTPTPTPPQRPAEFGPSATTPQASQDGGQGSGLENFFKRIAGYDAGGQKGANSPISALVGPHGLLSMLIGSGMGQAQASPAAPTAAPQGGLADFFSHMNTGSWGDPNAFK